MADRIVGHEEVDALHQIEAAPVPEPGQDAHADELEIVLTERDRQNDEVGQRQADRPDDEGLFGAGQPHENLMTEELAAAREIARIPRDLASRGGVLQRHGSAVGADVIGHGIWPCDCWFPLRLRCGCPGNFG